MKAIPMKGRLTGKKIRGSIWVGSGSGKENHFQLEDNKLVSAAFRIDSRAFWIRCKGATCEVTLRDAKRRVLAKTVLALPRGRM